MPEKIEINPDGTLVFLPDPGTITKVELPDFQNIRFVSAVKSESAVPPFYDGLIAQIIAHGPTRGEVIQTLLDYLKEIRITGISTNLALAEAIWKMNFSSQEITIPDFSKPSYNKSISTN